MGNGRICLIANWQTKLLGNRFPLWVALLQFICAIFAFWPHDFLLGFWVHVVYFPICFAQSYFHRFTLKVASMFCLDTQRSSNLCRRFALWAFAFWATTFLFNAAHLFTFVLKSLAILSVETAVNSVLVGLKPMVHCNGWIGRRLQPTIYC